MNIYSTLSGAASIVLCVIYANMFSQCPFRSTYILRTSLGQTGQSHVKRNSATTVCFCVNFRLFACVARAIYVSFDKVRL